MSNSYFYGLTKDNKIVGGDTALITLQEHIDELFDWFVEHDCVIGFVATHWECGFVEQTHKTWWGDETLKGQLEQRLEEKWKREHTEAMKQLGFDEGMADEEY